MMRTAFICFSLLLGIGAVMATIGSLHLSTVAFEHGLCAAVIDGKPHRCENTE